MMNRQRCIEEGQTHLHDMYVCNNDMHVMYAIMICMYINDNACIMLRITMLPFTTLKNKTFCGLALK